LAVSTRETFTVPRVITIGNSTLSDHLVALDAFSCKLILIALSAVDVMFLRDERLRANRIVAGATNKAFLMPLSGLVLHFLHACPENVSTSIAPGGKLSIVAGPTINSVRLGSELLVDKRRSAFGTYEAGLMPMFLFVRQVLRINPNDLATLVAVIGEHIFVAFDTVGVVVTENVSVTR